MLIQKKSSKKVVKASNRKATRRAVRASEEFEEDVDVTEGEGAVDVADEAADLLFEAEDVAELVAEVTGEDVAVTADEDTVVFEIGNDEFVVEAEGTEEILESTRTRGKKSVKASRRAPRARRTVRR